MAQSRSSQRGAVQLASSAILSGLLALLGLAGCSTDADTATGSGGAERVGSVSQALTCKNGDPCNDVVGDCVVQKGCQIVLPFGCNIVPEKDGTLCGPQGDEGMCAAGVCCFGCYIKNPDSSLTCGDGSAAACGRPGEECMNCDGGDTCMKYGCDLGGRGCTEEKIPDHGACTDNSGRCWQGTCCSGCLNKDGLCAKGTNPNECGKTTGASQKVVACDDCDDGNSCNVDICTSGVCAQPTPVPGNPACPDATVCNGAEVCGGGQCNPGTPLNCNDNNPCTKDYCDPMAGCKHDPIEAGTSCDTDNNVCNGVSKCDAAGVCKTGTALDCDDSNVCTNDSCDAMAGCKHTNNTVSCSDNNACTLTDKCAGGSCVGSVAPNCDDNNDCTTDTCDPMTQCKHVAVGNNTPCSDGNDCSTGDSCQAGKCLATGGKDCSDTNPCSQDTCSVQTQVCGHPDEPNDTPCIFDKCHVNSTCQAGGCTAGTEIKCDDSNPCTTDTCEAATGCKHVDADGGDCSDDDTCTTSDKCSAGKCVGTAKVCKALDACHLVGECDAKDGSCDDPRAPDGTECKTVSDSDSQCDAGLCPEPVSEGGAGGQTGEAGAGPSVGGTPSGDAGDGNVTAGGDGNEPGEAGSSSGGKGATSSGGSKNNDAGASDVPEHIFVRAPGGCSCRTLGSTEPTGGAAWLAGLALAAVWASRRRRGHDKRILP